MLGCIHIPKLTKKKKKCKSWIWWNIVMIKVIVTPKILWQRLDNFSLGYISWSSLWLLMVIWLSCRPQKLWNIIYRGLALKTSPMQTSMFSLFHLGDLGLQARLKVICGRLSNWSSEWQTAWKRISSLPTKTEKSGLDLCLRDNTILIRLNHWIYGSIY